MVGVLICGMVGLLVLASSLLFITAFCAGHPAPFLINIFGCMSYSQEPESLELLNMDTF